MYVLNPYLLSFFTVCSLNSTTANINLYSTSIPKQHAHILVDNEAQHEGTRGADYFFMSSRKDMHAFGASLHRCTTNAQAPWMPHRILLFLVQLPEAPHVYAVLAWTATSEEPSDSTATDPSCSRCLLWVAMRRLLSIQMRRTVMSAGLTPPILLA